MPHFVFDFDRSWADLRNTRREAARPSFRSTSWRNPGRETAADAGAQAARAPSKRRSSPSQSCPPTLRVGARARGLLDRPRGAARDNGRPLRRPVGRMIRRSAPRLAAASPPPRCLVAAASPTPRRRRLATAHPPPRHSLASTPPPCRRHIAAATSPSPRRGTDART